jgi:hypothetical protein
MDIHRLRALLAVHQIEDHWLPFVEGLEARPCDAGVMDENILALCSIKPNPFLLSNHFTFPLDI